MKVQNKIVIIEWAGKGESTVVMVENLNPVDGVKFHRMKNCKNN